MRILIIEDREKLANLIKKGLEKEGHAVDYVGDGEEGQQRIEMHHQDYDIVLLDLMMPKKTGFEVCQNIRDAHITIPILILTARSALEDKVTLLDMGADDYLIKPFEFKELLARIRALTRRPKAALATTLRLNGLVLNPAEKTVFLSDQEIKLSLTEFRLLEYLMRHPNVAVLREDLLSKVWDFNFDSYSNIVDVYIRRLRTKLHQGVRIVTIRGIGYKLMLSSPA